VSDPIRRFRLIGSCFRIGAVRVAFLYNAQDHHLLHSLPVACALSALRPGWQVAVLATAGAQLALAQDLARAYPGHNLAFRALRRAPGVPPASRIGKAAALALNARLLDSFDALVVPERTSLHLKRLGARRPKFIHTFHGSSGHDRADDPRLAQFDLLLAPSQRRLARILAGGKVDPRRAAVIGYSKRDLVDRLAAVQPPLFANARPTVIYNPHHWRAKSSWPVVGLEVLEAFAAQDRWNLVFAPHVRLFDPPAGRYGPFRRYMDLDHMRIDLGSRRSIDMTYLTTADLYLGDVSSQVFEFAIRPRPCLFLNPRRLARRDDPDFASWRLGPVVETVPEMLRALASVERWADAFRPAQDAAMEAAFPDLLAPAPQRGARAIAAFLEAGALPPDLAYDPAALV
jgi:hypothetical protein